MNIIFNLRQNLLLGLIIATSCLVSLSANAQNGISFANGKKITLIVPYGKGGSSDIIANIIKDPLAQELGTEINVLNISGLSGSLGLQRLKESTADGLTIGIGASSNLTAYPAYSSSVDYDPLQDFSFITNIINTPHILAVNNKFAADNFASFVANANKQQKPYCYASSGVGGSPHLLMEGIKGEANLQLSHYPLKDGSGSAIKAVLLGRCEIILDMASSIMPFLQQKELKPLAVGSAKRLPQLPNTPTFTELGLASVNRYSSFGLIAPKGVPDDVLNELNAAMVKVLNLSEVKHKFTQEGSIVDANSIAEFTAKVKDGVNYYQSIVAKYNLIAAE